MRCGADPSHVPSENRLQQTDQLFYSGLPDALALSLRLRESARNPHVVEPVDDVAAVIKKIQHKCVGAAAALLTSGCRVLTLRVRLGDYLADCDKLRSGFVTAAKFTAVLDTLGCALAPAEAAALVQAYAKPGDPSMVAWRAFDADIGAAVVDPLSPRHPTLDALDSLLRRSVAAGCRSRWPRRRRGWPRSCVPRRSSAASMAPWYTRLRRRWPALPPRLAVRAPTFTFSLAFACERVSRPSCRAGL